MIRRRKLLPGSSKLDNSLQSLSLGAAPTTADSKCGASSSSGRRTKTSRDAHDFLREWKRRCTSAGETLSFLTRTARDGDGPLANNLLLEPDEICRDYFSTDIDSEVLGGIIEALHLLVCSKKDEEIASAIEGCSAPQNGPDASGVSCFSSESIALAFTHSWLKALLSCGRFELSFSFLMPDQQKMLKEICALLKESCEENDTILLRYDALLN